MAKFFVFSALLVSFSFQAGASEFAMRHAFFSADCVKFVKKHEGFKSIPYRDTNGQMVIGYGRAGLAVKTITRREADKQLYRDLTNNYILLLSYVKPKLNQAQVNALCSFIYNVGPTKFLRSKVRKQLNSGDIEGAAQTLLRWNKSQGKLLRSLDRRRKEEAKWLNQAA